MLEISINAISLQGVDRHGSPQISFPLSYANCYERLGKIVECFLVDLYTIF